MCESFNVIKFVDNIILLVHANKMNNIVPSISQCNYRLKIRISRNVHI